jgi:REP element-mobilizing transposase RayT
LRGADCARIVADALLHYDAHKYALCAWCVMPNHVHVLAVTSAAHELGQLVREWKTITAKRLNARLNRQGAVWAADYFDRYIRDEPHFLATKQYIERNPVAAGLCRAPEEWPFSSAGWR